MQPIRTRGLLLAVLLIAIVNARPVASASGTLVEAIRRTDATAVKNLIGGGADVNGTDQAGTTPLMHAALVAGPDVVRQLIDAGAAVNAANRFGATALMWAVSRPENVKTLIARGANINARASNGWTALAVATRQSSPESMRILLAAGADATSPDNRRHVLTASYQASSPVVRRVLADAGLVAVSRNDVTGPLLVRTRDDIPALRHLLDLGLDAKESLPLTTMTLPTFFIAARDGQLDAMRALVERGMDPTFTGARGTTALTLAAGADRPNLAALRFLLDRGADVNATDTDGRTALDWALTRGETEVAAFLRAAGGRTNAAPTVFPTPIATPRPAREAIALALARLQPASRGFTDRAKCVSCHNEYIPGIAIALARRHGMTFDEPMAAHADAVTDENWERRRELVLLGETAPIAGLPPGVGYGLLQRSEAGLAPTPLTDAMTIGLANRQLDDGSWDGGEGARPPLNGNVFANTALAVHALRTFAPPGHRVEMERRILRARSFLATSPAADTQGQTFKLLGLIWSGAPKRGVARQQQALAALQRRDGGWGQMPSLSSDAYATGQALYALRVAGVRAEDPVYRRGAEFLLRTQLEDGTWFVKTRAFGVQPYFETGFPHGPSQFIAATATAWAAIALTHTLP